jgi:hypothetical protein
MTNFLRPKPGIIYSRQPFDLLGDDVGLLHVALGIEI